MSKILITGGAGYIGSHTIHYLIRQGIDPRDIIVFDNLVYGHQDFLPKGVRFVEGDLLKKQEIEQIFKEEKIQGVIHFAAYAYVGESMRDPGKYFENNVLGGLNLLEAMRKNDCKVIVFSSTCATYGMPRNIPIIEQESQCPINPYGESKLMFEKILGWYDQIYDIKHVVLRYFNAAGADFGIGECHDPETHLIPLVLKAAKDSSKSIKVFGVDYDTPDGTCIRDYIHVTDLADAHLKALQYLEKGNLSNYFNLGTGKGTSVKEIIELSKEISGQNIKVEEVERRSGDPKILIASNEKAKSVLDWKPQKDIKAIISSAWDWENKK